MQGWVGNVKESGYQPFNDAHGHGVAQQVKGIGVGGPLDLLSVAFSSSAFGDCQVATSGAQPIASVQAFGGRREIVEDCGFVNPSIGDVFVDDVVSSEGVRFEAVRALEDLGDASFSCWGLGQVKWVVCW